MFNDTTVFVDLELGDKQSERCFLDPDGQVIEESGIPTTAAALTRRFASLWSGHGGRCPLPLGQRGLPFEVLAGTVSPAVHQ